MLVYALKQEKQNRIKIGVSKEIINRLKSLKKDLGEFDLNSTIYEISKEYLNEIKLDAYQIEKTLHRTLKFKQMHLDFNYHHLKEVVVE